MWKSLVILVHLLVAPSLSSNVVERFPGRPKAAMEGDKPTSSLRIIGGVEAPPGRYPYAVSLESAMGSHVCGGSLIEPSLVITAAHCEDSFQVVVIGRYDRYDNSDDYERFEVDEKIPHPLYLEDEFPYDFLLVKLNGVSKFTPVRVNRKEQIPVSGMELVVMGFGVTIPGSGTAAQMLQHATVNYLPNEVCDESSDPDFLYDSYRGKISPDMMCASDVGEDSCQGDSGGPLIVLGDSAEDDIQVGLVSWGYGCALEAFPGVYGRLSYEIDWIESTACDLTNGTSTVFDCGKGQDTPTASPVEAPLIPVTVVIQLDGNPTETGWRIEDSLGTVVREVPPGTYLSAGETTEETVFLRGGEPFVFFTADTAGDGFCCSSGAGYFQLVVGYTAGAQNEVLVFGNGVFEFEKRHDFITPFVFGDELPEPTEAPGPSETDPPGPSETDPSTLFPITVVLQFDAYPEEVGWRIERLSADVDVIESVNPGTYSTPDGKAVETVSVQEGGLYNFVIFDIFEDGTCCKFGSGSYSLLFASTENPDDDESLILFETGDFGQGREHAFIARKGDEAGIENAETLTLEMKFDSFPLEVGWILEVESNEVAVEKDAANNLVAVNYSLPGAYGEDLALQVIRETIEIPPVPAGFSRRYLFTLTDSSEDGLCCGFGEGGFRIFYGPAEEGKLLVSGTAEDTARESHVFVVSNADSGPPGTNVSTDSSNGLRSNGSQAWLSCIIGLLALWLLK